VATPTGTQRFSCLNCAKPLDQSDKFCSHCGREVLSSSKVAEVASDIATRTIEKQTERYSQMSSDDLVRLSAELNQLTPIAQKALVMEIAKRGLKDSQPSLERVNLASPVVQNLQSQDSFDWNYEKMSDDELEQLHSAHQKLHQPINEALRRELDARASLHAQLNPIVINPAISLPSSSQSSATIPRPTQGPTKVVERATTSPPYARFAVLSLIFCFSASVGVFAFFDALARNTTAVATEAVSIALSVVFGWLTWLTWKKILSAKARDELKSKRTIRNVLVTSVIFLVLYLGLAALLGNVIGQNRQEAIQLNSDIENQKVIAERITKARTTVSNSIPAYVAMYAGIEPDVNSYSSTLLRLRQELPLYNSKFPKQAETMQKFSNTIEREIRRCDLLRRQIFVANRIAQLGESEQGTAWRSEMLPIIREEDALDESK